MPLTSFLFNAVFPLPLPSPPPHDETMSRPYYHSPREWLVHEPCCSLTLFPCMVYPAEQATDDTCLGTCLVM